MIVARVQSLTDYDMLQPIVEIRLDSADEVLKLLAIIEDRHTSQILPAVEMYGKRVVYEGGLYIDFIPTKEE